MAKICLSSHHDTLSALIKDEEFRRLAEQDPFLLELRLDHYLDLSIEGLQRAIEQFGADNLVVTYRSPEEGGRKAAVSDETRGAFMLEAIRSRVAFLDVELATAKRAPSLRTRLFEARSSGSPTQFLFSFHDFVKVPEQAVLEAIRRESEELGADAVKIAVRPLTLQETLPLALLLRQENWKKPFIGLAMGEEGFWTRVLGPIFPHAGPFTFARSENAQGTAVGQPTWRDLSAIYRFDRIDSDWPVFGVIGNPIAHSKSPLMQNSALQAIGMPGVYVPFKLDGNPVAFMMELAPLLNLKGISVTIPHKEGVMAGCKEISPLGRQIGAINTLHDRGSACPTWFGTNTDASAAASSLESVMGGPGSLKAKNVLILGAGGAARAVAFGVRALGANVLIHNRTAERAQKLAEVVGGKFVSRKEFTSSKEPIAAVVNTTSLGMHPHVEQTPLEENEIPEGSVVFDTVYNPVNTKLLQLAQRKGCKVLTGLAMFVGQGADQFELFTGRPAPREIMKQAVSG